jgi:hypothetical protein
VNLNSKAPAPKKPYRPPELRVYGGIQALTKATLNSSKAGDGGTGKANKT